MDFESQILEALRLAYGQMGDAYVNKWNVSVSGLSGVGIERWMPTLFDYDPIFAVSKLREMRDAGKIEIDEEVRGIAIRNPIID